MRLSKADIEAIKASFDLHFSKGKVILFGSRLDDEAKGGDIDLLLIVPKNERTGMKRLDFLLSCRKAMPYTKIDVVFFRGGERPIEKSALQGVVIHQKSS